MNPDVEKYAAFVSADTARAHLGDLQAAGLGYKAIAARSGVAPSAIGAILWGDPARGRGLRENIRSTTRDRLLAIPVPSIDALKRGQYVTAVPASNRVRALHHIGYSLHEIARLTNLDHQRVRHVANHPEAGTRVETHVAIAALFAARWNKPHNPTERFAAVSATRSRNAAQRNGWPMPIDLDEDGYLETDPVIDDHDEETPKRSRVDFDELVFLVRSGATVEEAARRVGTSPTNLPVLAARHDRHDVVDLLRKVAA